MVIGLTCMCTRAVTVVNLTQAGRSTVYSVGTILFLHVPLEVPRYLGQAPGHATQAAPTIMYTRVELNLQSYSVYRYSSVLKVVRYYPKKTDCIAYSYSCLQKRIESWKDLHLCLTQCLTLIRYDY